MELMDHQKTGVQFMFKHAPGVANFSQMGTGKTAMAIRGMCEVCASKVMVVCPTSLMYNWEVEIAKWATVDFKVRVLDGTKTRRLKRLAEATTPFEVVIINYEALNSIGVELVKWAPELIIADECFTGNTLVKTPDGFIPIQDIQIGDMVCNAIGIGKVLHKFHRLTTSLVKVTTTHGEVICTPNHPFLTEDGWIKACELNELHEIKTYGKTLSIMQEVVCSDPNQTFLRNILFSEVENEPAISEKKNILRISKRENQSFSTEIQDREPSFGKNNCGGKFEKDARKQPNEERSYSVEGQPDITENGAQAKNSRRQWAWTNTIGRLFIKKIKRLCLELRGINERTGQRISKLLQGRFSIPIFETGDRSRWVEPLHFDQANPRQEKRKKISRIRVVSVESIKPESFERYGFSREGVIVYNLEVEGHPSYLVTRCEMVVHNCHQIKNHKATKTKALKLIAQKSGTKYRWIMTGTPAPNNPLDIFSQFDFIRPGYLAPNFYVFRAIYAEVYTGAGFPMIKSYRNLDRLKTLVGAYSYRVLKEECLDLPEKTYQQVEISLDDTNKKIYKDMSDHLVAEIGGEEVSANIVLVKLLRLQQITSGFITMEDGTIRTIGTEKLSGLRDLLDSMAGEKVVVWARFNHEIKMIREMVAKEFPERKCHVMTGEVSNEDRQKMVEDFQSDSTKESILVANIQVGGVGITLTKACYAIYYSRTFSLGDAAQSEDRIHRIGQGRKVTYYDLTVRSSIDTYILRAIRNKATLSDKLTGDDIKRIAMGGN